jgi:hypothetical protein
VVRKIISDQLTYRTAFVIRPYMQLTLPPQQRTTVLYELLYLHIVVMVGCAGNDYSFSCQRNMFALPGRACLVARWWIRRSDRYIPRMVMLVTMRCRWMRHNKSAGSEQRRQIVDTAD